MGNNPSSSCTAVPSAAACRTDHVVALLGGALAASIYHVSCGSIMLWNSAQKHWSPPPHGKMHAVRRWIRSALHPAEHALEASSCPSYPPSAFYLSQLQNASFSASGKELLGRQNEFEAKTLIKPRTRARRMVRSHTQARPCNALGGVRASDAAVFIRGNHTVGRGYRSLSYPYK